jgi:hypothetical protein
MRVVLFLLLLSACSRLEPLVKPGEACHRTDVLDPALLPQRVEWVDAAGKPDQRLNELWCETVGPALFDPTPAPTADTAKVMTDSVAVISWNTHVGGGEIERLVRDLRAGRLTNGDSVRHFVLLLQEVYRSSDSIPKDVRIGVPARIAENPPSGKREDIMATATKLGLSLLYVPSMRNGVGTTGVREDRGNAVLSTFPLKDPVAIELPIERQRRVLAGVTIEGHDANDAAWKLKLYSVHLDNRSRTSRPTGMFGIARVRQSRALVDALKDEHEAIGIAGDLNTWNLDIFERAIPYLRARLPRFAAAGPRDHVREGPRAATHRLHVLPPASRLEYALRTNRSPLRLRSLPAAWLGAYRSR